MYLVYILLGLVTGVFSGFLGIGGGRMRGEPDKLREWNKEAMKGFTLSEYNSFKLLKAINSAMRTMGYAKSESEATNENSEWGLPRRHG